MPDRGASGQDGYHQWIDQDTLEPYGSYEVFWVKPRTFFGYNDDDAETALEPGWYWWACFPGCLPDGEPVGPFDTSRLAMTAAL